MKLIRHFFKPLASYPEVMQKIMRKNYSVQDVDQAVSFILNNNINPKNKTSYFKLLLKNDHFIINLLNKKHYIGLFFNDIHYLDLALSNKEDPTQLTENGANIVYFDRNEQYIMNQLILENPDRAVVAKLLDYDLFSIKQLQIKKKNSVQFSPHGFFLKSHDIVDISNWEIEILDHFIQFYKQAYDFIKQNSVSLNQEQIQELHHCINEIMMKGQVLYRKRKNSNLLLLAENEQGINNNPYELFFNSWQQEIKQLIENKKFEIKD